MKRNLPYWISTALFAFAVSVSGTLMLSGAPELAANFERLGYPAYLMTLLGAAKLAGAATLLAPGLPRLKEWAYAGFTINLVAAAVSHVAVGDPMGTVVPPVALLGLMAASWWLRPGTRALGVLRARTEPAVAPAVAV